MGTNRRHTPFPGFVDPITGRYPVFPERPPMTDSDRVALPEDMPHESEVIESEAIVQDPQRQPATTDDIMAELRASRQDVTTKIAGVAERVTSVQQHVLNAMSQISSIGERALDLEQTITAASAMLRTAAEPQRDDGPDVISLKTKLLVVAATLGRITPRKPMTRHELFESDLSKPSPQ